MPPRALSVHPYVSFLSAAFGGMFLTIGLAYIFSPRRGYELFGFSAAPSTPAAWSLPEWALIERIMVLYGAKDAFVGVAILAATLAGNRRNAGLLLVAAGACAGVDGWVVRKEAGGGEWNHWGYGSVMVGLGGVMMGVLG
ncbi:hypothetical protein CC77DRAFT_1026670 [Alternaria alternata]|jgi:hypothetical protein|uniref:Uncharacterized protein n=2 Tax=Alternaria alternata complex TaxID=187734 RepID=A0A177D195_ALTAL|nr:hypothetical protein CC77DRAFT_1026670 [Alternaria alternata]OAG13444.1 hypothetical protein CC77DRAFT_1026670 [Alternaria alternata]RII13177.1 hypothetical protein CUC08_Gglean004477 [Alternaria sp. MG1]RYN45942.1 hypothetical protein AA0114_g8544 [Alternaria tenuissima]RYN54928.1 hypothetical protein AA0118_g9026 [Alternaria tenuissima]